MIYRGLEISKRDWLTLIKGKSKQQLLTDHTLTILRLKIMRSIRLIPQFLHSKESDKLSSIIPQRSKDQSPSNSLFILKEETITLLNQREAYKAAEEHMLTVEVTILTTLTIEWKEERTSNNYSPSR